MFSILTSILINLQRFLETPPRDVLSKSAVSLSGGNWGTETYFPKSIETQNLGAVLDAMNPQCSLSLSRQEEWDLSVCIFLGFPMEGDNAKTYPLLWWLSKYKEKATVAVIG